MPHQHFLGAAFIGGFSLDGSFPARKRPIWVRRRNGQDVYETKPHNVAWQLDLFTIGGVGDLRSVDDHLGMTDARIAAVIDSLVEGSLTPRDWISTLVPFVATLFVRSPEFGPRFVRRLRQIYGGTLPIEAWGRRDNTNLARALEMQRLLSPVMRAEWTLLLNQSSVPLIASDLGYTVMTNQASGRWGYAIPLRIDALVAILAPPAESPQFHLTDPPKATRIGRVALGADAIRGLNNSIAIASVDEVYGATRPVLQGLEWPSRRMEISDPAAGLIIPAGFNLRQHDQEWLHALGSISDHWVEP